MSSSERPPAHVPTLTEVVTWPKPPAGTAQAAAPASPASSPPAPAAPAPASPAPDPAPAPSAAQPAPMPSEGELVDRVLANLHRQVDLALEVKLREALAPVLARASDAIVREARRELTATLRELVARAIAQELARRGQR